MTKRWRKFLFGLEVTAWIAFLTALILWGIALWLHL